jgi:peptide/nickel transport system substrate-binding protein
MTIRVKSRARTGILLTAVLLLPILAACGTTTASPTPPVGATPTAPTGATPAPATDAPAGGTLTAAWIGPCCLDVDTNNVLTAGGDYHWWSKIHGRLFTYTVANQQYDELVGELADTWSVSADNLTWEIKLREGVTWHDGTPFTAEDVKFSLELCLDPKTGGCTVGGVLTPIAGSEAFKNGAADLSGVRVVDPQTVTITTTTPNATLADGLAEVWILPKHSLGEIAREQVATSDWWTTQQIGVGPFKWVKHTPGQSIELARNETYWRGAPKLDGIIRRQFSDPAAALLAFENGELDFTYVTADEVARLQSSGVGTIHEGPSGVDNMILVNPIKHPEFANPQVKAAMMHAIDRQAIVDNIYGGAAEIVPCLYGNPNLKGDVQPHEYDPATAKQLLDDSGETLKSEYVWDTYYNDALSANVMTAIQQNWKDNLGLNVKLQPMDPSAWTARYYDNGESDLALAGGANGPTGNRAFQYHHSSSAWPTGGNGFKGYSFSSAELDRLLEQGAAEFDTAKQAEIYQQACQVMHDELPWMYLWQSIRYHIVSDSLQNVILIPAPGGGSYYDAVETWTKSQ